MSTSWASGSVRSTGSQPGCCRSAPSPTASPVVGGVVSACALLLSLKAAGCSGRGHEGSTSTGVASTAGATETGTGCTACATSFCSVRGAFQVWAMDCPRVAGGRTCTSVVGVSCSLGDD